MDIHRYHFDCRKVLHFGLRYAKSLGHDDLEVEHVALALIRSHWDLLGEVSRGIVEKSLEDYLERYPRRFHSVRVEFGPRLNQTMHEVEQRGHKLITIEALWTGLLNHSIVLKKALQKSQKEEEKTREFRNLIDIEDGSSPKSKSTTDSQSQKSNNSEKAEYPDTPTDGQSSSSTEECNKLERIDRILRNYTSDLTEQAVKGMIDPVIGRDQEVRRVLEILGRKKKNNPVLVGDPGVGKSAIAEGLALRITQENVPESLLGVRVLSLDLGSLIAGSKYRGEFEDRLKKLVQVLEKLGSKIILFIDEIHMIIGAGQSEGGADAANLLKPVLTRGSFRCLGATTITEYRRYIEKDAALERRFQPVFVEEPNREETISILRGLKTRYEIHHGVQIEDDALIAAVNLSIQYLPTRRLPDKAIDLIDECASRVRLQLDSLPRELDELKNKIHQLEIERETLRSSSKTNPAQKAFMQIEVKLSRVKDDYEGLFREWKNYHRLHEELRAEEARREELNDLFENTKSQGDYEYAAQLQHEEIPKVLQSIKTFKRSIADIESRFQFLTHAVNAKAIAQILATWTGIPLEKLLSSEKERMLSLEDRLRTRIFGQNNALTKVGKAIRRARASIQDPNRPIGIFLFLGPTGVGKTETARAIAEEMFGDEKRMIRLDMSEFAEPVALARLIGAPPGYVGYEHGGELTDAIRARPYSLVLFDEIEKAHPKILDILLQILEDGRLTDSQGRTADFRHALVVLTSNLIREFRDKGTDEDEERVRQALTSEIRPELVNRIDDVIVFNPLSKRHLSQVLDRLVRDLNLRLSSYELKVSLGEAFRTELMKPALTSGFGGRALRRTFQRKVIDLVAEKLMSSEDTLQGAWLLDLDHDGNICWQEDWRPHLFLPPASS